jgi:hypothetical protein
LPFVFDVEGCLFKSGPSHFGDCGVFLLPSALVHFYVFTWSKRSIEPGRKSSRPSNVVRGILDLAQAPVSPNHPEFALINSRTQFQAFIDLVAGGLRPQNLEKLSGITTWEVACSTQARVKEISESRYDFLLLILLQEF